MEKPLFFDVFGSVAVAISLRCHGNMNIRKRRGGCASNRLVFYRNQFPLQKKIFFAGICHSTRVVLVDEDTQHCRIVSNADGLMTRRKDVLLAVNYADCFPVVIFDKTQSIITVLHVGLKGAISDIVALAIGKMKRLGSQARNIKSFVGPGICQEHYAYGPEALTVVPLRYHEFLRKHLENGWKIDIAGIIRRQMEEEGLKTGNCIFSKICTFERSDLFSARRDCLAVENMQSGILVAGFKKQ